MNNFWLTQTIFRNDDVSMDYTSQSSNPVDFSQNVAAAREKIIGGQNEKAKLNLNNVDQSTTSEVQVTIIMTCVFN